MPRAEFSSLNPYSNGMKIERQLSIRTTLQTSLNPYSNGMKIEQQSSWLHRARLQSLNPYSNGMKIELTYGAMKRVANDVLILILME